MFPQKGKLKVLSNQDLFYFIRSIAPAEKTSMITISSTFTELKTNNFNIKLQAVSLFVKSPYFFIQAIGIIR